MQEKCGVVGISRANGNVARGLYYGLYALQHRGQESAGIVTHDGFQQHDHVERGLVGDVFTEEVLSTLQGSAGIGHVRYPTAGSLETSCAQPFTVSFKSGSLALSHNGNLVNASDLRQDLASLGHAFTSDGDTEVIAHDLARNLLESDLIRAVKRTMQRLHGSYSLTVMHDDVVLGVRDPEGNRPLCIGELEDGYVLASESAAVDTLEGEIIRDVRPGELVVLEANGSGFETYQLLSADRRAHCFFEWVYFARPDSVIDGQLVYEVRRKLGRQLWEALPSLVGTEIERALRRTVATGEVVEVERFHAASTAAWYDVQASPSDSGLTVVFRDVSAHVREERRLRAVATAEANAADELRSVDRVKNAFITAVSHELRTPLTVVSGMADTLVRLRGSADTATRERVEDSLAANARRLSELLDDLLDTDRLVRGVLRAERREVSLVELVEGVIGESGVADRVVFDAPPWLEVAADPVLVERSVRNLLENVEKYAPEGPVEVMLAADATGGFVLAVHDEGPGVPVDDAERIFEPFHRLDDHPQPGTGVGLSLVAEFARLHGGRAYADTSVQRGARIVVEVPGGPDAVAGATAGEQDPGVASG